ncbi:DNA-binding NarL/FixJ family response regulator [Olsenella profusa DSM 13989]|uniref:Response regulator receiver domain protein n=1 Tax=Olsenella profusa F0195 TaxID=1125712 RepID=U2V3U7_9ACTN|nr:response regulator transcription factor [Olsenella profusa]ERL10032.1 response regulator receiver domain protein [Olsenella profusa F0195]MDP9859732.1 DNA-binding NarL/FixJ family response regulator [Olsenella profusa DSM 13989]
MRVIVVDDDAIVAKSLRLILSAEKDIDVVGLGTSGPDAVRLFEDELPEVLLMDIQMPDGDGLTASREILGAHPTARIVFLTTFSDDEYITGALRLGARGYLIKQDIDTIAPALRAVMAGQSVLGDEVLERATALGAASAPVQPDESALSPLTTRERDVVRAVADGLDNKEIAGALCLSEGTVRNHISAVLTKLGLRNRTQLAVFYYQNCR